MGRTIINFDEATFRLVPIKQKIWAPIGTKPKIWFWFSNTKANIFGALKDGQKIFFDWFTKLNADCFINFVKKLIASLPQGKYVFVLDNAPAHKAKKTKEFLNSLGGDFAIEYLPPYSPQLNCIETCWKITRHEVTSSNYFKNIDTLKPDSAT